MKGVKWFRAVVTEEFNNIKPGTVVWVAKAIRYGCDRDDVLISTGGDVMTMSVTNAKSLMMIDKGKARSTDDLGVPRSFKSGYTEGSPEDRAIKNLVEKGIDLKGMVKCPRCNGRGRYGTYGKCYLCKGKRKVTQAARALHFVGKSKAVAA